MPSRRPGACSRIIRASTPGAGRSSPPPAPSRWARRSWRAAAPALGGVSCTGAGEAIIRVVLARRALDHLQGDGEPDAAARAAVDLLVKQGRGEGGLILVDARGRVGYAYSTPLMPVAWMSSGLDAPRVPF